MKRLTSAAVVTVSLGLCIATMIGCGGGLSDGGSVASINSFAAAPTAVQAGQSVNLTAVFSGGTGVIAPGNLPVTSGTQVTVSPAATTTYTLTVTATSGTIATGTVVVTVVPPPTITSFEASPATIAAGASSDLTAVFAGGSGIITPGNLAVTSGTPVSVSPTATTNYTLTVSSPAGTAITQTRVVSIQSVVTVDESSMGPAVTDQILGMNLAAWYDIDLNKATIVSAFQNAGIRAVRWPGGEWSDFYHWDGSDGAGLLCWGESSEDEPAPGTSFMQFVDDITIPGRLDVALTADYGSNPACNGPGQPSEAAAWASAALADGITVSHMTVGNEEYGDYEIDLHTPASDQHSPTVYASSMTGSTGFYQMIKAASPNTLVGVDVDADDTSGGWDQTVLANAKGSYDFVEFHYYPEAPNPTEAEEYGGQPPTDEFLTEQAAQELTAEINTIRKELTAAGEPDTPIYIGEIGSTYSDPGKQSMSITQALYAGQALGEMMNDGVSRATWWLGFGGCHDSSADAEADYSSLLYGWQNFGGYMVFSDGLPESTPQNSCTAETLAAGTPTPTARAFQLFSQVAQDGEYVLNAGVSGDVTNVRAYAATHSGGTALVLFNLNETISAPVTVTLSRMNSSSNVTITTYSKAIYDLTQNNTWAGPATATLGTQTLPLSLVLDPWSMNVIIFQP